MRSGGLPPRRRGTPPPLSRPDATSGAEPRLERTPELLDAFGVVELPAERVSYVEGVDDAIGVRRHLREMHVEIDLGKRARDVEQQSDAVGSPDLDHREEVGGVVVDADADGDPLGDRIPTPTLLDPRVERGSALDRPAERRAERAPPLLADVSLERALDVEHVDGDGRSEERRVGKEGRSRG